MAAAIPYGIMGGQAIYGWIKNRQAAKQEQQARAQEQQMLTGATGVSNQLTQSGTNLTAQGMPGAQQAGSYYSTLLGGNRAQMAEATAGGRGAITDQYRGAERSLERSGIRGATGDLAKAELSRDRVGKIAGLTTGVQGQAANNLADLSTNLVGQGGNRLGAAGSIWSGLLGNRTSARYDAEGTHQATSAAFGRTLFDLLSMAGTSIGSKGKGVSGLPGGTSGPF
jgi:hypothetical protein